MKTSEILTILLEKLGMSKSEFARQIGITPQALQSYFKGDTKSIKHNFANRIIKKFPSVNINFLVYGKLPIFTLEAESVAETNVSYLQKENVLLKQENEMLRQRLRLLEERNIFEPEAISDALDSVRVSGSGNRKKSESKN